MITNSTLHYTILRYIIDKGFAPDVATLAEMLQSGNKEIVQALFALQEYHGVVLHPNEPKIWVIHPFSLAPTNFFVKSEHAFGGVIVPGVHWALPHYCAKTYPLPHGSVLMINKLLFTLRTENYRKITFTYTFQYQ